MGLKLAAIFLCACLALITQGGCSPAHVTGNAWKRTLPDTAGKLDVQFLGIKEGEATLLRFSQHAILIDTGTKESVHEVIKRLQEQNVRELDALILTNSLEDYCGGAREIIHSIDVKEVGLPAPTAQTIIRQASPLSSPVRLLKQGNKLDMAPGIELSVLSPAQRLYLTPEDNSLVLQMTYNKIKILFTSAIHQEGEQELPGETLGSQILKVSDGGTAEASSQAFIERVDPQTAIIFTGKDRLSQNQVIRRLSENWSDIYLTQQKGTVHVITNGTDYFIYTEKGLTEGTN
jgi:competence protein ComEC